MIGCFDLPQTQKERHAVRVEAAVSAGALRDDTKNGCVGDYSRFPGGSIERDSSCLVPRPPKGFSGVGARDHGEG